MFTAKPVTLLYPRILSLALTCLWLFFPLSLTYASTQPYLSKHGVVFSTGNKFLAETDFRSNGSSQLISFKRYYNSQSTKVGSLGHGWSVGIANLSHLVIDSDSIVVVRGSGKRITFIPQGENIWVNKTGRLQTIILNNNVYKLDDHKGDLLLFDELGRITQEQDRHNNTITFTYNAESLLTDVTDSFGQQLNLSYNENNRVGTLSTPIGLFNYTYDINDNLETVTKPDNTIKTYLYEDPNDVHNLTGIINEKNVRIHTLHYDVLDRVISSAFAEGEEQVSIEYPSSLERIIVNGVGVTTTYNLVIEQGVARVGSSTGPGCTSCGSENNSVYVYNTRQQVIQKTDARGTVTEYEYDTLGNRSRITEAVGTANERSITTTYTLDNQVDTIFRQSVVNQTEQSSTSHIYDPSGNLLSRTDSGFDASGVISGTTTYSHDQYGRILSVDGPRIDVSDTTNFTYYPNEAGQGTNRGQLQSISNALSHSTTFSNYTALGKAATISSPLATIQSTYDSMGRLLSKDQNGLSTSFSYTPTGKIETVTSPGGRVVSYSYLASELLSAIQDNTGNKISYFYDSHGNKTAEEIYDPGNTLRYFINYSYHENRRLDTTTYADNTTNQLDYDAVGNLISSADALNRTTSYSYDPLNRLTTISEPGSTITGYAYDNHNNLIEVTDAEYRVTSFNFDDFGRKTGRTSPDTGFTNYLYDPTGNLISTTDSDNITTSFVHDALSRLLSVHYLDSSRDVIYSYDENGFTGLLTSIQDSSGSTSYQYNNQSQVISETRVQNGLSFTFQYGYNDNFELTSLTYPSGRVVNYQRNSIGQIASVYTNHNGATRTLADTIGHLPFGPVSNMTLGNGLQVQNSYDQLYRLTNSTVASLYNRSYSYFANSLVQTITDNNNPAASQSFIYDDLNRLLTAQGEYGTRSYNYDKTGNRLNRTANGEVTTYSLLPDSNRLTQSVGAETIDYQYNNAGHVTQKGDEDYSWSEDKRLLTISSQSNTIAQYNYDSRGLRTERTVGGTISYTLYDSQGNLLIEADHTGRIEQEYAYLNGRKLCLFEYPDKPQSLANGIRNLQLLVSSNEPLVYRQDFNTDGTINLADTLHILTKVAEEHPSMVYYHISDHLETVQMLTNEQGDIAWQGDYSPFGQVDITVNRLHSDFRMPGQQYDSESGLHYNWHRYYDPATGRYISADPIGLAGGMNLYAYVGGDPINWIDPWGLTEWDGGSDPNTNLQPIPGYNYCGRGNTGGRATTPLDIACREHDECYDAAGLTNTNVNIFSHGQGSIPEDQDECDDALCEAAGVHGEYITVGVRQIFCDCEEAVSDDSAYP